MEEFEYKKLLIIMIVMWVIIPTLTNQQLESNEILFFLLLYLGGGYMRLYGEKYKYKKHMMFKINIITLIFTWSTVLGFNIISEKIPFVGGYTTYFYGLQKVTILILAVTLFYIFENLHIKQNKLVNIVSSTTFGVYLIHDNVFMREYIWHKIVNLEVYIDSIFLPVYIVGVSVIVYIVAGGIEFIRKQTVEKIYEKILESI